MNKKTRILSLILAFIILFSDFSFLSSIVSAGNLEEPSVEQDFTIENGVLIKISDKKKEEISLSGTATIPDEVTEIAPHVFQGLNLTSVILGASLEKIGAYTFSDNKIDNVTFPDSLKEVSDYAFRDNKLSNLDTNKINSIGLGAFSNNKLTTVNLTDSLQAIEDGAFRTNDLSEVNIPVSVTSFGTQVFADNNRYVRISGDNTIVQTERIDGHYGHVVGSAIVKVKFIDEDTDKEIISSKTLGEDLSVEGEMFEVGKSNVYKTPEIAGYVAKKKK